MAALSVLLFWFVGVGVTAVALGPSSWVARSWLLAGLVVAPFMLWVTRNGDVEEGEAQ